MRESFGSNNCLECLELTSRPRRSTFDRRLFRSEGGRGRAPGSRYGAVPYYVPRGGEGREPGALGPASGGVASTAWPGSWRKADSYALLAAL